MNRMIKTNGEYAARDLDNACMSDDEIVDYISEMSPMKLKDLMCDVVGVNHHTPKTKY